MPTVTITGAAGTNVVQTLQVTTAATAQIAQLAANNISTLFGSGGFTDANINSGFYPTIPTVGSIGQATQAASGTLTVFNIPTNVQALTINNSGDTFASNSRFAGSETILSGTGNLNFTDNGASTRFITGGGSNTITETSLSSDALITGDGRTIVGLNSAGQTTVTGTGASADTIFGSASVASGLTYNSATGASVFINPRAANVTVFGAAGAGTETVFGGSDAITGKITVVDGTGLFAGGINGGNTLGSSTVGSTTLIGGGAGDVLTSKGIGDKLVAGAGAETLIGTNSAGGDVFFGSTSGSSLSYGSQSIGDTFFTAPTTQTGTAPALALLDFIDMHTTAQSVTIRNLNTTVSNTIAVGFDGAGANYATVGDFITGVDKVVLNTSVVGGSYTLSTGTLGGTLSYTNLQVGGGLVTFYNATLTTNDIIKI